MKGGLPKRFSNNIIERPENLSTRRSSQVYDDLADTLNVIDPTKGVILDLSEAEALFGKYYRVSIKGGLKKRGVDKPRTAIKDGKLYIWATKV